MSQFFISTVRYDKVLPNGAVRPVNEQYLLDALSFTEAEARTIERLTPYMSGEFVIAKMTRPRIAELVQDADNGDRFYRVGYAFTTLDEKTGQEKRQGVAVLVKAHDFADAYDTFKQAMASTLADWELVSIAETTILDYFPYSPVEKLANLGAELSVR